MWSPTESPSPTKEIQAVPQLGSTPLKYDEHGRVVSPFAAVQSPVAPLTPPRPEEPKEENPDLYRTRKCNLADARASRDAEP